MPHRIAVVIIVLAACAAPAAPAAPMLAAPPPACREVREISTPLRIGFERRRDEIQPYVEILLDEIARMARERSDLERLRLHGRIEVCLGEDDIGLAQRRANAVAQELVARGIPRDRIDTIAERPRTPQDRGQSECDPCSMGGHGNCLATDGDQRVELSLVICDDQDGRGAER